jgi:hypothetical protein
VDIKGHDGVIYKGRIDADKLPTIDLHKKNSNVSSQRSRLDVTQSQRELPRHDQERNGITSLIPNLEPVAPREESFT